VSPNQFIVSTKNFIQNIEVVLRLNDTVAIGKPEQHVHKTSNCGSKQQYRSPDKPSSTNISVKNDN